MGSIQMMDILNLGSYCQADIIQSTIVYSYNQQRRQHKSLLVV